MGRFDKIFGKGEKGKRGEEVNEDCLAALKASAAVVSEKCQLHPRLRIKDK